LSKKHNAVRSPDRSGLCCDAKAYSSALTQWRRQYQAGALQALKDDKRGRRRTRDARDQELERLHRENERLNKKLRQAELIIEIQKKVAAMLGNPIETPPNGEDVS